MAYDEDLAHRIRAALQDEPAVTERRMFGGLAFMIQGRMAVCAVSRGGLMVRVDPAASDSLVHEPDVRRFEMRGRELDGWLEVGAEGVAEDDALGAWVGRGVSYARSLPPK